MVRDAALEHKTGAQQPAELTLEPSHKLTSVICLEVIILHFQLYQTAV